MRQDKPSVPVINAADASVNQASAAIVTAQLYSISVQNVSTGTSTGTVKLQYSNDLCLGQQVPAPTHWTDIPSATIAVTAASVTGIPKTDLCYGYVRVVYTATNAAAGTITVLVNGQGF